MRRQPSSTLLPSRRCANQRPVVLPSRTRRQSSTLPRPCTRPSKHSLPRLPTFPSPPGGSGRGARRRAAPRPCARALCAQPHRHRWPSHKCNGRPRWGWLRREPWGELRCG
eukprot:scaffold1992_cov103-Isochrysis_galbana.AAC.3